MRLATLLVCLAVIPVDAQFPQPDGYVNDFAGVLDQSAEDYLETYLATLERETSAEVAIVTVVSLDGMTIEEYANTLFAQWGIGQAETDNGVLLMVAPRERRVRIEVGYGLESILPDGLAGEIIRTDIAPEFSAGNYPRGIGRGVDRIARIVRRESSAPSHVTDDDVPSLLAIPFFGTFMIVGGVFAGLGIRTKTMGPLIAGGILSGIPLLIAVASFWGRWVLVLPTLQMVALTIGYRKGRSPYWISMLRNGTPPAGGPQPVVDHWMMGGKESSADGSSFDSDSSSSSASDFGGGSSGGGGASGRY